MSSRLSIDTDASGSANCCHICLEEFISADIVSQSKNPQCPHVFHESCISEWLMVPHDSCPVCRNAFLVRYHEDDEESPNPPAEIEMNSNENQITMARDEVAL